jgi:hypothetical protein
MTDQAGDFSFTIDVQGWDPDTNTVWGLATCPSPDRQNEVIETEAVVDSLPNFSVLPILIYFHTDRPIGSVTVWDIDENGASYCEAKIKPTPDCDDIRAGLNDGSLSQFSISAHRLEGSPSCWQDPDHRTETCHTTAMDLYSISLCPRGTANCPQSFAEVKKADQENHMDSEDTTLNPVTQAPEEEQTAPAEVPKIDPTAAALEVLTGLVMQLVTALIPAAPVEEPPAEEAAPAEEPAAEDVEKGSCAIKKAAGLAQLASRVAALEKKDQIRDADIAAIKKARPVKTAVLLPDEIKKAQVATVSGGNFNVISRLFGGN